jgi:hypothetical protein
LALSLDRQELGETMAQVFELMWLFHLSGGLLEPELEEFFFGFDDAIAQLLIA